MSGEGEPLVEVDNVQMHFRVGNAFTAMRGVSNVVKAVNGASFALAPGESVGLLGESGCGKTTLGRLLLKLLEPTAGTIKFGAENLHDVSELSAADPAAHHPDRYLRRRA